MLTCRDSRWQGLLRLLLLMLLRQATQHCSQWTTHKGVGGTEHRTVALTVGELTLVVCKHCKHTHAPGAAAPVAALLPAPPPVAAAPDVGSEPAAPDRNAAAAAPAAAPDSEAGGGDQQSQHPEMQHFVWSVDDRDCPCCSKPAGKNIKRVLAVCLLTDSSWGLDRFKAPTAGAKKVPVDTGLCLGGECATVSLRAWLPCWFALFQFAHFHLQESCSDGGNEYAVPILVRITSCALYYP